MIFRYEEEVNGLLRPVPHGRMHHLYPCNCSSCEQAKQEGRAALDALIHDILGRAKLFGNTRTTVPLKAHGIRGFRPTKAILDENLED